MKGIVNFHSLPEYLDETNFPKQDPVIADLISRQELTLLSATAKTGKTWLALHMGLSVASGTEFLETFQTIKSKVLLVQTEVSHPQFRERILKMLEHVPKPWDQENLIISQERFRIDTPEGLELLGGLIAHTKASLVILDPLYTLHKKDEDKAKDVAPMLSDLKRLGADNNAAVVLVHHQGKSHESNGNQTGHQARGSSSLADVPDNLWSLRRTKEDGLLKLSFELRNLAAKEPLSVRLTQESVWKVVGYVERADNSSVASLISIVQAEGELSRESLIQRYMSNSGKGKRTAEDRIATALKEGRLRKRQDGKEVTYSLPGNLDGPPQERSSPGVCGIADDRQEMSGEEIQQQMQWEAANER